MVQRKPPAAAVAACWQSVLSELLMYQGLNIYSAHAVMLNLALRAAATRHVHATGMAQHANCQLRIHL